MSAAGFREAGRLLGALGLPTVLVQEGGYDLATIGPLVRRGAARDRTRRDRRHASDDRCRRAARSASARRPARTTRARRSSAASSGGRRRATGSSSRPGVYARDDYVAGDARSRAADLNALFADPEVDVVQCLQGGFGSAQTIPLPRLRRDRRQPEAVRRLLGHHRAPRRDPAAHRARDALRLRADGRGRQRHDGLLARAPARGAHRRRRRRGAARPRRPVRARDPRRQGDRAARRRLPLAAAAHARHAVGDLDSTARSSSSRTTRRRRTTSTGC